MSTSDPFDIEDRNKTVFRPRPGGKQAQTPKPRQAPVLHTDIRKSDLQTPLLGRSNIFLAESFSILSLAPKIRNIPVYHDIKGLYQKLVDEILEFQEHIRKHGESEEDVSIATLFLCALLDEAVLNTPWGSRSDWKHSNLSVRFFQQISLGNIFFNEIERLKRQPRQKLALIKLAYVCISLGFHGKYRTINDGVHRLEEERKELYLSIQEIDGDPDRELSVHWKGRPVNNPLIRYVPLWVISVVACLILLLSYSGFLFLVSKSSYSVYDELINIAKERSSFIPARQVTDSERVPKPPPVIKKPKKSGDETERFRKLLSEEIAKDMVKVMDGPIIRISNVFKSGKAEIKNRYHPILKKIADEVKNDKSRIRVFGHTDNLKIRFSLQFPDNHKLSEARAESAVKIMRQAHKSLAGRLSSEGKGYSEPIVPNDTKKNRAINRRIDIQIR